MKNKPERIENPAYFFILKTRYPNKRSLVFCHQLLKLPIQSFSEFWPQFLNQNLPQLFLTLGLEQINVLSAYTVGHSGGLNLRNRDAELDGLLIKLIRRDLIDPLIDNLLNHGMHIFHSNSSLMRHLK